MRALVVGGSGGIGAALARQLAERADAEAVTATWCRHPPPWQHPQVTWVRLDPQEEGDVAALAAGFDRLDWLINAVGFLHQEGRGPERTIRHFDPELFARSVALNTLPSLLLAKHFSQALKGSPQAVFAALSARVGSIGDNRLGGWYSYRAAKAALNMALRTLAIEWRRSLPHACVAALHPGTVDTPLSRPFQRGVAPGRLFTPDDSARCLLEIIARLSPAESGRFWSWDGTELPW